MFFILFFVVEYHWKLYFCTYLFRTDIQYAYGVARVAAHQVKTELD